MAGIMNDRGQVSVRLNDPQAKALERYRILLQNRLRKQAPGWVCSTSHAVRDLILRGLKTEDLLSDDEINR